MDSQAHLETSSALADYFRAVEDLGASDEPTRQAIARLILGSVSLMDAGGGGAQTAVPDPLVDEPAQPPPPPLAPTHFLEPAEDSVDALGSELVEIQQDADSAPTFDSSEILPPLILERTAPVVLPYSPLFSPQGQRAILSQTLSATADSTEPDLEEIVRRIGNAIPLDRLPMKPLRTLSRGVQLLIDLGAGMEPFAVDRARIGREIRSLTGNVERLRFRGSPLDGVLGDGMFKSSPWQPPQPGVPILVVSDLGMNRWSPRVAPSGIDRWIEFSRAANESGCPVLALVPLDPADWLPALERRMSMIPWDRKTSARSSRQGAAAHPQDRTRHAHGGANDLLPLKRALSLAVRMEPELIRAMRVGLFPALGVSSEASLWEDPDVETRNAMGLVFLADRRRQMQSELARDPAGLEAAWKIIEPLHGGISPAIQLEEKLAYKSLSNQPAAQGQAAEMTRQIVATLASDQRETFSRWALHAALRMPAQLKTTRDGIHLQQGVAARNPDLAAGLLAELPEKDREIPAWLRPSTPDSIQAGVRLVDGGFEIGPVSLPGSHPLALPKMRDPWLDLASAPENETATVEFHRVHFKLPAGGRFPVQSTFGFILRTPSGQRFQLAPKKLGHRRAMIVCCDSFSDRRFEPLGGWSRHVEALSSVLRDQEVGGFETCEILRNPDTPALEEALHAFYSHVEPEDATLLICGNAVAVDDRAEPQLIGINSTLDPSMRVVPIHRLKQMIASSPAASHAVIIDCLTLDEASSRALRQDEGNDLAPLQSGNQADEWLLRRQRADGPSRLASKRPQSESPSDPFPEILIDGLRLGESDTDRDGRISVSELRDFVQRRSFEQRSTSDSFESHSSGDTFKLAKASVCGLAHDLYVSSPMPESGERPAAQKELVRKFLRTLRARLDEIIGRPDAVKIRMSDKNIPPAEIGDEIRSIGVFLDFLTPENSRSEWLHEETRIFSEEISHTESDEPRIFPYNIDQSGAVLNLPGERSIYVKPLSSQNLEEEARSAAESIAATLSAIRRRLRRATMK